MGIISGLKIAGVVGILIALVWFYNHYTGLKDTIATKEKIISSYETQLKAAAKTNADNQKQITKLTSEKTVLVDSLEAANARELSKQKEVTNAHIEIEQAAAGDDECPVADSLLISLDRLRPKPETVRPGDNNPDSDAGAGTGGIEP